MQVLQCDRCLEFVFYCCHSNLRNNALQREKYSRNRMSQLYFFSIKLQVSKWIMYQMIIFMYVDKEKFFVFWKKLMGKNLT